MQLVQPPLPLCPAVASLSPSGDASWWGAGAGAAEGGGGSLVGVARGPEWLVCIRESMELMSAVLSRELPATFVAKELLPKVRKSQLVLGVFDEPWRPELCASQYVSEGVVAQIFLSPRDNGCELSNCLSPRSREICRRRLGGTFVARIVVRYAVRHSHGTSRAETALVMPWYFY